MLVLAAAVPVVVVVVLSVRVLTGGFDRDFFAEFSYDESGAETVTAPTGVTFWQRWNRWWFWVAPAAPLAAAAATLMALAVLQFVGRPVGMLPGHLSRWVAVGVAALTAVVSWGMLVVALVAAARPDDDPARWYSTGSLLSDVGFGGSLLLVAGAVATASGLALARPGPAAPQDDRTPPAVTEAATPEPTADEPSAPEPTTPEAQLPHPVDTSLYERPRS